MKSTICATVIRVGDTIQKAARAAARALRHAAHGCLLAALVAGCTSPVTVREPGELRGDTAHGQVKPLSQYLATSDGKTTYLKLIMLHGVGDTCSGYALGSDGWLSGPHLAAIGFAPLGPATKPELIYSNEFLGGPLNKDSYVAVQKRHFLFAPDPKKPDARVDIGAIEITWSAVTRWVKTQELGYDFTGNLKNPKDPSLDCMRDTPSRYAPPPKRESFNAGMKELLLDRGLADAVLYMGSYGVAMRKGVAEGICYGLSDKRDLKGRCIWPEPSADTRYILATHSLGSAIAYDTLLDLIDPRECGRQGLVEESQQRAASQFASSMITDTPVIYMMANQLPLIALASIPPTEQPRPGDTSGASGSASANENATPQAHDAASAIEGCEGLSRFVAVRQRERAKLSRALRPVTSPAELDIIAFSDPNDLLSWGIPAPYVRSLSDSGGETFKVNAVNVYVQNATRWFGFYENPGLAHVAYFNNPAVWKTIVCGASDGNLHC